MTGIILALAISAALGVQSDFSQSDESLAMLLSESPTEIIIALNSDEPQINTINIEDEPYLDINISGLLHDGREGMPNLPVYRTFLMVPDDGTVEIETIQDYPTTSHVSFPPQPVYHDDAQMLNVSASYVPSGLYPEEYVSIGEAQTFRGMRLIPLTYYPVQYNADTGELIHHEQTEIAIRTHSNQTISSTEELLPDRLTIDSYRFLRSIALNMPHRDDDGARLPRGGYLIATDINENQIRPHVERLADWKRACGHYVEIVYDEADGMELKNGEITDGYNEWDPPLEYACIIGEFDERQYNRDITYGCLDGANDKIAEVAVGRLGALSASRAEVTIIRAINYQSLANQGDEDMEWMDRAGAMANHVGAHTVSVDHTINWVASVERTTGFENVCWRSADGGEGNPTSWIRNGLNICFERGFTRSVPIIDDEFNPIWISVGGGHVPNQVDEVWDYGSRQTPFGPSILTGTGHNPQTMPCNILCGGMTRGLLINKLPLGWARAFAMENLENYVPGGFAVFAAEYRVLGDPSQKVWLGQPDQFDIQCADEYVPGQNCFEIVIHTSDGDPVSDALITMTMPGELISYSFSDENGQCAIELDPSMEDDFILTITKDGIKPFQQEINAEEEILSFSAFITDVNDDENGNGDGVLNPGETATITIGAHNLSTNADANDVTGIVSVQSDWLTVEAEELHFGDLDAGDEQVAEEEISISLGASAPQDFNSAISIRLHVGEQEWLCNLFIEIEAPQMELHRLVGGNTRDPGLQDLNVRIRNNGTIASQSLDAELVSPTNWIQLVQPFGRFESADPGDDVQLSGDEFVINPSAIAVPGSSFPMFILLRVNEDDIPDTIFFNIQIDEPREGGPIGPDKYGYICFDNTDDGWDATPEYDWIEIDPDNRDCDFEGTNIVDSRTSDQMFECDLPFTFVYYGEEFNSCFIAENGFISLGDDLEECKNADNFPLDALINGSLGMIAPFWDNLSLRADNANIFTYFNEDEHTFIVQWNNMRHESGNDQETFQVILFDPVFSPVVSGDGLIKFQYKDMASPPYRGDAPQYFSVGICSPSGDTGLNYSYDNEYPDGCAPIRNQRALLFTTSPDAPQGVLTGTVIDVETNRPMIDVLISTSYGQIAFTDGEGRWTIPDAWALPFDITAQKQGWNDSTLTGFELEEDEEFEINFGLLHPVFTPSQNLFELTLSSEREQELEFSITNEGNGPLDWSLSRELPGDANAEPWELRRQINASAIVGDPRLQGAVFVDDEFFITGSNSNDPMIYVLNRNGENIRQFNQTVTSMYGMKDLTWDGEWLWGSGESNLIAFNKEGEVMRQIRGPFTPNSLLAWDQDRQWLWVANTTTNIMAVDREGNQLVELNRRGMRMYGLAYFPDDFDEHPLYIYHKITGGEDLVVSKYNPEIDGDIIDVTFLAPPGGGTPGGCYITNTYDVYSWIFISTTNDGANDRLDIWQVEARKDWFQVDIVENEQRSEAFSGQIQTGETKNFILTINTSELPDTLFQGELAFSHNADDGSEILNIELMVIGNEPPGNFGLLEPEDGSKVDSIEATFNWEVAEDPNPNDNATYTLTVTADEETWQMQTMETSATVNLSEIGLDVEWMMQNFAQWSVVATSGEDVVECNADFTLMVEALPTDFELNNPVDESELEARTIVFDWHPSVDLNPMDEVEYHLWIESGNDSVMVEINDTTAVVVLDSLALTYDVAWPLNWWVNACSDDDSTECVDRFSVHFPPSGLLDSENAIPVEFSLQSIFPNPFNAITRITFGVDRQEPISVRAFDVSGRQVAILYNGIPEVGWHQITWNADLVPTGVYFIRLDAPGRAKIAKTTLVK